MVRSNINYGCLEGRTAGHKYVVERRKAEPHRLRVVINKYLSSGQRRARVLSRIIYLTIMVSPHSLGSLPTEIFQNIVSHLGRQHIDHLSLMNKRLRAQCLPLLFRHARVSFSPSGLTALRGIADADHLSQHVVCVTYGVTDILDPNVI